MTFQIQKRDRWDPFYEMGRLQDALNEVFETSLSHWDDRGQGLLERAWGPAVDMYETKDNILVRADIPGMKKEDIEVSIQDNLLIIKGERRASEEMSDHEHLRVEQTYGAFSRAFSLPSEVDSNKVSAIYRDGVLELTLPKKEGSKPEQIHVEVK